MSAVGQPTTATPKPDATRPSIAAEAQRAQFVTAADQELTGHRWHPSAGLERHEYVGRPGSSSGWSTMLEATLRLVPPEAARQVDHLVLGVPERE